MASRAGGRRVRPRDGCDGAVRLRRCGSPGRGDLPSLEELARRAERSRRPRGGGSADARRAHCRLDRANVQWHAARVRGGLSSCWRTRRSLARAPPGTWEVLALRMVVRDGDSGPRVEPRMRWSRRSSSDRRGSRARRWSRGGLDREADDLIASASLELSPCRNRSRRRVACDGSPAIVDGLPERRALVVGVPEVECRTPQRTRRCRRSRTSGRR